MERLLVECLSCGQQRAVARPEGRVVMTVGECPRCGYVGWAPSVDVTERIRRLVREIPVAVRGLGRVRPV